MDKPSIDDLLKNVSGVYELASVAAKRAVAIKKKTKGVTQPLQHALEEIKQGVVDYKFEKILDDDSVEGEQIELPLDLDGEKVKLESASKKEHSSADDDEDVEENEDEDTEDPEDISEEYDEDDIDDDIVKDKNFDDDEDY